MIFAQTFTAPVEFAAWTACAAFALMIFNQGNKAWRNLTGSANRRTVDFAVDPVARSEFEAHVAKDDEAHNKLYANMSTKEKGLREEFMKELRGVRGDLKETSDTMHELKGEMKQLSIALVQVQQTIQNS